MKCLLVKTFPVRDLELGQLRERIDGQDLLQQGVGEVAGGGDAELGEGGAVEEEEAEAGEGDRAGKPQLLQHGERGRQPLQLQPGKIVFLGRVANSGSVTRTCCVTISWSRSSSASSTSSPASSPPAS